MNISFFYFLWAVKIFISDPDPLQKNEISMGFADLENLEVDTNSKKLTSWKNESVLIPIVVKKSSEASEKIKVSVFSHSSFTYKIAKLEYVLGDLSAGACGVKKKEGTFEEAYFPDRVNFLSDDTLVLDHEVNYFLAKVFVSGDSKPG